MLLQTSGTFTESVSAAHCTLPPSGVVFPPKSMIVGAATAGGGVVEVEVVLGLVVVGGVLLDRGELRVVEGDEDADDRLGDEEEVPEEVGVPPGPVGSPRPLRTTR